LSSRGRKRQRRQKIREMGLGSRPGEEESSSERKGPVDVAPKHAKAWRKESGRKKTKAGGYHRVIRKTWNLEESVPAQYRMEAKGRIRRKTNKKRRAIQR